MPKASAIPGSPKCQTADHRLHRRVFLQGLVGTGALSMMSWGGLFSLPAFAETAKRSGKRCILLWLCGAPSQFETWDPKPGRPTGGPFLSIPTSVPGYRISELMPRMAARIHKHTAIIRSLDTKNGDHVSTLEGGKPTTGVLRYPGLGAMIAHELADPASSRP